jgi:hypothetical protein
MDPYVILGVSRDCTREQVKEAFRSRVHQAHPDRGGDGEAFVRLCSAYRQLLHELEQREGPIGDVSGTARPGHGAAVPVDLGATRETYLAWLKQVSKGSGRRRRLRWWSKHPSMARAGLLGLIGLCGVLVLCAAVALGTRTPRQPLGLGTGLDPVKTRTTVSRPIGGGAFHSPERGDAHAKPAWR